MGGISGQWNDALMLDNDIAVPAATIVWTGGVRPHPAAAVLRRTDRGGRIPVSTGLEALGLPDVFVVGDDAVPPDPEPPAPFHHSAGIAAAVGRRVAENVAARWQGRTGTSLGVPLSNSGRSTGTVWSAQSRSVSVGRIDSPLDASSSLRFQRPLPSQREPMPPCGTIS